MLYINLFDAEITFVMADIAFKVAVITSPVAKITFVVAEVVRKMAFTNITLVVAEITFKVVVIIYLCCDGSDIFNVAVITSSMAKITLYWLR